MKKYKYAVLFSSLAIILLAIFWGFSHFKIIEVKGKKLITEVVLTQEKQKEGLGGRRSLCSSCAMLFDFKEEKRVSFWMKDMQFDLDIIWISNNQIIYIKKNFSHKSKEVVNPNIKADKVLEIGAGLSDKFDFKVGDSIKIY